MFHFLSLSIIPSYDCNAKCSHCYSSCGKSHRNKWDIDFIKKVIDQAQDVHPMVLARNIHFAGGEPFIYYNQLVKSIKYAQNKHFHTSIVTNGFWGINKEDAESKIKELIKLGLTRIELSVDSFHQEFIPISSIRNLLYFLRKYNVYTILRISTTKSETVCKALKNIPYHELSSVLVVASPVSKSGRASDAIEENDFYYTNSLDGCCFRQLNLSVRFDGNVTPCCAGSDIVPLLSMENIYNEEIKTMVKRYSYKSHIRNLICKGPQELYNLLKKKFGTVSLPKRYTSICNLCTEIFKNEEYVKFLENEYTKIDSFKIATQIYNHMKKDSIR